LGGRVGESFLASRPRGEVVCGASGDELKSAKFSGLEGGGSDHSRHRSVSDVLEKLCRRAGFPHRADVVGEFAAVVPHGRRESFSGEVRERRVCVPDFLFGAWKEGRAKRSVLAELKLLSCCPSRYKTGRASGGARAVEARARGLQGDYERKAGGADRKFCGVQQGEVGPVLAKLRSFGAVKGLVFGAWGEASQGVHELVQQLAERKAETAPGPHFSKSGVVLGPEAVKGLFVSQLRKEVSCGVASIVL